MKKIILLVLMLMPVTISQTFAGWAFNPSCYEDCVLKNMKGVESDLAAKEIMRACRKKFPIKKQTKPSPEHIELTTDELAKISGEGLQSDEMTFICQIHNGNSNIVVDELSVVLWMDDQGYDSAKVYTYNFSSWKPFEPQTTREISYHTLINRRWNEGVVNWSVVSAKGYRKN